MGSPSDKALSYPRYRNMRGVVVLLLAGLLGCASRSPSATVWIPKAKRPTSWSASDTGRALPKIVKMIRSALPQAARIALLPVKSGDALTTLDQVAISRDLVKALVAGTGPRLAKPGEKASHALALEIYVTPLGAPSSQRARAFVLFASLLDLSTGRWLVSQNDALRLVMRAPPGIESPMAHQYTSVRQLQPQERVAEDALLDDLDLRAYAKKVIAKVQTWAGREGGSSPSFRILPFRSRSTYKVAEGMLNAFLRGEALLCKASVLQTVVGPVWTEAARKLAGDRAETWVKPPYLISGWYLTSGHFPSVTSTLTLSVREAHEGGLVKLRSKVVTIKTKAAAPY